MKKTGVCVFIFLCVISAYSCCACQFCGGAGLGQGGYGSYADGSMYGYGGGLGGLGGLSGIGGLGSLGSLEEELGGGSCGCGGGGCGGCKGGTDLNIGLNHRKCGGPLEFGLSLKVGGKGCDSCNRKSCACGRCSHLKEKIESNKEALRDYLATKAISRVNFWDRLLENRLKYKLGKLGCI